MGETQKVRNDGRFYLFNDFEKIDASLFLKYSADKLTPDDQILLEKYVKKKDNLKFCLRIKQIVENKFILEDFLNMLVGCDNATLAQILLDRYKEAKHCFHSPLIWLPENYILPTRRVFYNDKKHNETEPKKVVHCTINTQSVCIYPNVPSNFNINNASTNQQQCNKDNSSSIYTVSESDLTANVSPQMVKLILRNCADTNVATGNFFEGDNKSDECFQQLNDDQLSQGRQPINEQSNDLTPHLILNGVQNQQPTRTEVDYENILADLNLNVKQQPISTEVYYGNNFIPHLNMNVSQQPTSTEVNYGDNVIPHEANRKYNHYSNRSKEVNCNLNNAESSDSNTTRDFAQPANNAFSNRISTNQPSIDFKTNAKNRNSNNSLINNGLGDSKKPKNKNSSSNSGSTANIDAQGARPAAKSDNKDLYKIIENMSIRLRADDDVYLDADETIPKVEINVGSSLDK